MKILKYAVVVNTDKSILYQRLVASDAEYLIGAELKDGERKPIFGDGAVLYSRRIALIFKEELRRAGYYAKIKPWLVICLQRRIQLFNQSKWR